MSPVPGVAGVRVRPATAADAAALAAIYAPEVLHACASYELEPPDAAEMARRLAAVEACGLPFLVADMAGQVLGYAYASPFRQRPAYRYTVEDSVYVAAGAQGRGLGRLLLEALIGRCTALGYRRMVAVIGDAGNAASVRLHRSLGFAEVGLLPGAGFKHGRWLDWLMLHRPLGEGDRSPP
ncbi:GNAT family N-acetyltransferase [Rhodospirillum centenum]|uniref:Phosphinothricin N-acetyltransferase n=1 Tax=Rhodospirillum centenum (strain ATCC 51521 / SW) TaxID=414684 RepID=B6IX50_RHOCS|nr:GNAT family N-acetyltransferase [Rhodospirillum centenum]ACJ00874.1 phosphinothricin N-acetyltransferase [Rhodospirillum centenum SW]